MICVNIYFGNCMISNWNSFLIILLLLTQLVYSRIDLINFRVIKHVILTIQPT